MFVLSMALVCSILAVAHIEGPNNDHINTRIPPKMISGIPFGPQNQNVQYRPYVYGVF